MSEGYTPPLEQASDVINGKRVSGPPQDILEAKNAYEAYERISEMDPYSIDDLLAAHGIMMDGLTPRQVERILAKLKKEGKIARRGARKNGYWEVL